MIAMQLWHVSKKNTSWLSVPEKSANFPLSACSSATVLMLQVHREVFACILLFVSLSLRRTAYP